MQIIQDECPEKVGKYISHSHLKRMYGEICDRMGWTLRHWTWFARGLSEITIKKEVKRDGRRFVAYRIPAPSTMGRSMGRKP